MCCLCDACKWGWRPLGITNKKGVNAGYINFTQLAVQWKYTLAHWPRFRAPFCQYCLRMAVIITESFGISITDRILEGRNNKYRKSHGLEYNEGRSDVWKVLKTSREGRVIFRL